MNIEKLVVGYLECNCYILDRNNKVLVIDPGDGADKIISRIGNRNVVGVIVTHHHFDHVGALNEIISKYNIMLYDRNNLIEGINKINDYEFECIYTPGHKEDAITIYFEQEKVMFCGDFIFKNGIGRCDLPGGNLVEMFNSVNKIKKYKSDIIIYPGHGDETNILAEIDNNKYFKED